MGAVQSRGKATDAGLLRADIPKLRLFHHPGSDIEALPLHHRAFTGAVDNPKSAQTHKRACRTSMQLHAASLQILAGVEGVEPANAGIKIRCLNQLGDTPTQDDCQLPCGALTANL